MRPERNDLNTRDILEKVKNGELLPEEAMGYFRKAPFEELGYAKIDHHRKIRCGFPEVVFCEGKEKEYLASIYERLFDEDGRAFGTRATKEQASFVQMRLPSAKYDPESRILQVGDEAQKTGNVAVCCAGTADIPVAEEAAKTAEFFGAKTERIYDVGISGIHRLLSKADILQDANCIIAVAGMEGALPSVIGGLVANPVIAVPTSVGYGANLGGLSALLTMLNSCANGVAVVNIDNGFGAGYLATQINRLAERRLYENSLS